MDFGMFQHRDFAFRAILQNHLAHDLTEGDRNALYKGQYKLQRYVLGGAVVGPLFGAGLSHYIILRRAAKFAHLGTVPPVPRGWYIAYLATGGLLGGFIGSDVGLLFGARAANKLIEQEGDAVRIAKAFRAASAEVLREQAKELESGSGAKV